MNSRGRRRCSFILSLACVTIQWSESTEVLIAQQTSVPLRESVTLDVPLLVAKQVENIRGLIEQQQWSEAILALDRVAEDFPDSLVNVGSSRYLNAVDAARLITTQLPADGLRVYREQTDGWAGQQFEQSVLIRDAEGLRTLLRDAYASSWGDDALWQLGEWQWEDGHIAAARQTWSQLLPVDGDSGHSRWLTYPDSDYSAADVHARLVMCSIVEQDFARAESELHTFSEQHPSAQGTIAGRKGIWTELLSDVLQESLAWSRYPSIESWPTFARDSARNGAVASQLFIDGPQWMIPLAPLSVQQWERDRSALGEVGPLGRYPVISGEVAFFHDGQSIRALRLSDGKQRWPTDDESDIGNIYPPFKTLAIRPLLRPAVGVPRYTTTIDQGRLFALTGPSILTLPEARLQPSPTRLVSLDIGEGEGLLKWFIVADEVFDHGWQMTGTPVSGGDRLYIPLMRTVTQPEQAVACLSAEDGKLIWQQTICQALAAPLEGRVQLGHQLLSLSGDRVYCSTDLGAIASLDTETGVIRWIVTYASDPPSPTERSEESLYGLLPPLICDGRVYVKPNDSDRLMAIDLQTGTLVWSRSFPSRTVHLLGVAGTDLYVSGDQLWSIDTLTGQTNWRFGYDDPAGFGYGRGAIAGDHIFWPTHESLYTIDRRTGLAVQRYSLTDILGVSGGHIVLGHDRLLVSGPDHLTAFRLAPIDTSAVQAETDSPK
ncbi:MAG: PQQ-binding-like beta-propeller repeat protein [Planctomycetaceae bacterium]|nr:PQQ-binding-like beta-propeller repeat protein [Planctomycetaceae bacterium]